MDFKLSQVLIFFLYHLLKPVFFRDGYLVVIPATAQERQELLQEARWFHIAGLVALLEQQSQLTQPERVLQFFLAFSLFLFSAFFAFCLLLRFGSLLFSFCHSLLLTLLKNLLKKQQHS